MKFKAYTTTGCFYCTQLKKLFERANIECEYLLVGKDIDKGDFIQKYPMMTGYPFVLVDDEPLGGLVETAKYMLDKGLVSSKKSERS